MEPFKEMAGAAAALGGAFRFMFASLVGAVVITKSLSSTLPLAGPAIIFSLLGLFLFKFKNKLLNFNRPQRTKPPTNNPREITPATEK